MPLNASHLRPSLLDGESPVSLLEIERELCRRSFREFIRRSWKIVEPGRSFVTGWHIDAIAEHLQACIRRQIRRLVINIPPRHMKSISAAVDLAPWTWIELPSTQFAYFSYAHNLSLRDSVKSRRLIQSNWYQDRFGASFALTGDQNAKHRYENDRNGYRLTSSIGGLGTGEGGDIIIVDDPHNVREAESDVVRQSVLDWWDDTMQTRLNDPKTGVFIVIMQRVHALDLSGHILKEAGYDHLCLPAEYERNHPFPVRSSIGFKDPRTKEGEPLWKERFDTKELLDLKMTAYARAGQLQQRPSPRGGSILLEKWWRKWDVQKHKMPRFEAIYQSYDCAQTEEDRESASYSARTTWGVFRIDGQPQVMLLDRWRERVPFYELRREAKRSFKEFKPDLIVVENKSAGTSLIQDLRMAGLPVVKYTPDRDKDARAHSASILLETGKVWYIDATWSKDVINWCAAFPAGDGEDIVDTVTQLLIRLRNQWFIIPGDVESQIEEDDEDKPTPKPRRAVYG